MNTLWRASAAIVALAVMVACNESQEEAVAEIVRDPTAVKREARIEKALAGGDSTAGDPDKPIARWVLPPSLREISGLAITSDGRLLVHGDEAAQVWEVDYRRGALIKRFTLGASPKKGDFEGITIVDNVVWMMESDGKLYQFKEGAADAQVDFKTYNTGLKKDCEFEGLAYDPKIKSLLLACKNIEDRADRDAIIIYRWSLAGDSTAGPSRLMLPVASVRQENPWTSLQVSDITVDPATGNYVLLASKERAIVVITPEGQHVSTRVLPEVHEQPEGIAIVKGMVLVSDEAVKDPAVITLYRWP